MKTLAILFALALLIVVSASLVGAQEPGDNYRVLWELDHAVTLRYIYTDNDRVCLDVVTDIACVYGPTVTGLGEASKTTLPDGRVIYTFQINRQPVFEAEGLSGIWDLGADSSLSDIAGQIGAAFGDIKDTFISALRSATMECVILVTPSGVLNTPNTIATISCDV